MTDHNVSEYLKFLQKNLEVFRLQQPDYLAQSKHASTAGPKDSRSPEASLPHASSEEEPESQDSRDFALNSENQKLLGEFLQKCEPGRWLYEEGFEFEFLSQ